MPRALCKGGQGPVGARPKFLPRRPGRAKYPRGHHVGEGGLQTYGYGIARGVASRRGPGGWAEDVAAGAAAIAVVVLVPEPVQDDQSRRPAPWAGAFRVIADLCAKPRDGSETGVLRPMSALEAADVVGLGCVHVSATAGTCLEQDHCLPPIGPRRTFTVMRFDVHHSSSRARSVPHCCSMAASAIMRYGESGCQWVGAPISIFPLRGRG